MNIQINGIRSDKYKITFQHLANLFFENVIVSFADLCEADLIITYTESNLTDDIHINSQLSPTANSNFNEQIIKSSTIKVAEFDEALYRRTVLQLFLKSLQELTNLEQDWGILTGIRPIKLFHKKLQAGKLPDDIKSELIDDYLISEEKVKLMDEIVKQQLNVIPDLYELNNEVSIYIGIPFCPTKCAYCTFPAYAITGREGSVNEFLQSLHQEIAEIGAWLTNNNVKVTTIYFGGGTPTSISAQQMDELYEKVAQSIPHFESVREITVEAGRPDTITDEKLAVLNKWKIDRISINPQSFKDETLIAIGRNHTVSDVKEKFELARNLKMDNINMDLIIGLPGETIADFENSLAEIKKLQADSITVHTLSFKRASEMTKNKEKYRVASSDEITNMMEMATNWMKNNKYDPYYLYRQKNILGNLENIGYAKKNKESLYNIIIMEELQTIIGLGCGASSKFVHNDRSKITRYANPKQPRAYTETINKHIENKLQLLSKTFNHYM